MEKKIKKMMMDLKYLMNHGEVDMDIADVRYQKMLFGALEATGKDYTLHVHEEDKSSLSVYLV
ncbi:hypothetical protein BW898_25260 [Bacillus cereus]|nr:hypothetical protein DJ94_4907 [Bacillus pseudomycoides]OOQ92164.1 hypothetical protein BW898_25260 [Bacillus cereus]